MFTGLPFLPISEAVFRFAAGRMSANFATIISTPTAPSEREIPTRFYLAMAAIYGLVIVPYLLIYTSLGWVAISALWVNPIFTFLTAAVVGSATSENLSVADALPAPCSISPIGLEMAVRSGSRKGCFVRIRMTQHHAWSSAWDAMLRCAPA